MRLTPALLRPLTDRLLAPLAISLSLSACFYFMIFNRSGETLFGRVADPLFLGAALVAPALAALVAAPFLKEKTRLGVATAAALMICAWCGTWYQAHHGTREIPPYYLDFEAAGSFNVIYLFYTLFFLVGGYAFGFLARALDPPPPVDPVIASLGSASKAKRRKKKRKKALLKKRDELGRIVDEVLDDEGDDEADEDEPDESDDDGPAAAEPADGERR